MARHAEQLLLEGPDACAFAHAQFGSNVASLAEMHWQFSAWLNAQGRVRAFFHLARIGADRYLLLLRGGQSAVMAEDLKRFVFRAKVSITALPATALSAGRKCEMYSVRQSDDGVWLGCGSHSLHLSDQAAGTDDWALTQLRLGWPWLSNSALNQLLPAQLSLQRLGAVAIDKGCYPGQEIVARLHFRGGNKRQLCSGILSQPCSTDDLLENDGSESARIIDVAEHDDVTEALVILHENDLALAKNEAIALAGGQVSMQLTTIWPA